MDRPQRDRHQQSIFLDLGYDDIVPMDAVPERSNRGEWYFRRLDLTGRQFSGMNFQGADFSYCHAPRSNWASAYLAGARFCGVNLQGADLRGCYCRGADLRSLDLRGADLRGADLSQTDVRGANFRGADIAGVCWHQSRGDRNTQFPSHANLENLGIQITHPSAQWSGLNLNRADLRYLDLSHANLTQTLLLRADLRSTNLGQAILSEAELSGSIYDAKTQFPEGFNPVASGCIFLGDHTDLSSTDLSGLDLSGVNLQGADLSQANLQRSLLINTNLTNINLTQANLTQAIALGCDLTRANVNQVKWDGIDLRTARLPSGQCYGAERSPFDAIALERALCIHDPNLRRS